MKPSPGDVPANRRPPFLTILLGCIMLLFIAILVLTYLEARRVNPVVLDERGMPR